MTVRARFLLLLATLLAGISPLLRASAQGAKPKVALIIGNAAYAAGPLPNGVNDAQKMGQAFERLGFQTTVRTNVNQKEMLELIRDWGARLAGAETAVFYFSGHGMAVGGHNFLIPLGAEIRKQGDVELEGVDVERVLNELRARQPGVGLVILDACRDNPLVAVTKSQSKGLIVKPGPLGTVVAFAASDGEVALAPRGAQLSLYTEELLRHIETPGLRIDDVFSRTRAAVVNRTNEAQVPEELTKLTGPVVLAPQGARSARSSLSLATAAPPKPKVGDTWTNPVDGAKLLYVPAGEFPMGTTVVYNDDAKPVRMVRLTRGYWIYKTEVTREMYAKFLATRPHHPKPLGWDEEIVYDSPQQPVAGISWQDAQEYCGWATGVLPEETEIRLPTEAEWEYAARGTDGRSYPWGNKVPTGVRAVFGLRGEGARPGPASSLERGMSWCGVLNMAGNVTEYCEDSFDRNYYRSRPKHDVDPKGPEPNELKILRGGHWGSGPDEIRTFVRSYNHRPYDSQTFTGVRPVRSE